MDDEETHSPSQDEVYSTIVSGTISTPSPNDPDYLLLTAPNPSFLALYQFASIRQILLLLLGVLLAIINGVALALSIYVFSQLFRVYQQFLLKNPDVHKLVKAPGLVDDARASILGLAGIAVGTLVVSFGQAFCWEYVAEHQVRAIREKYMEAVYKLPVAYHDLRGSYTLLENLHEDFGTARNGMGNAGVPRIVQNVVTFGTCIALAFVYDWELALILFVALPATLITSGITILIVNKYASMISVAYAPSNRVAARAFKGLRTVLAFDAVSKEQSLQNMDTVMQLGIYRATARAFGNSFIYIFFFATYAAMFWYSADLIIDGRVDMPQVISIFLAIVGAILAIGQIPDAVALIQMARHGLPRVFQVISHAKLVPVEKAADINTPVLGRVEFYSVDFSYPTRVDVNILKGFSMVVEPGQVCALIGPNGCGKSTVAQLLERFYDVNVGKITLDGVDIRTITKESLRSNIGFVGQEADVFTATVQQNIVFGCADMKTPPTLQQVQEVCKLIGVDAIINKLEDGYETMIGPGGVELSAGEAKRLAIARALIRNPRILLLDEPTAGMDAVSERTVMEAIFHSCRGRTAIIITTRADLLDNPDKVVVMADGTVVEKGSKPELLQAKGIYYQLMSAEDAASTTGSPAGSPRLAPQQIIVTRPQQAAIQVEDDIVLPSAQDVVAMRKKQEGAGSEPMSIFRILIVSIKFWGTLLLGTLGVMAGGSVLALFAWIFAELMIALAISPLEPDNLRYTTHYWVYFLMGLGVLAFGSRMVQSTFLGMTAERVARSQRALAFAHVFELPLSFFSKPENSPIMLVTRIAIGPANASEMLVGYFAEGMFHMITLTAGAILSVSRGWSLALSLYALYPIASGASDLQQNALLRLSKRMKRAYRRTIRIVTETVPAIRTVLSLNRTQTFLDYLVQDGGQSLRIGIITAIISSLGFGISQALLYLIYTIGFFYGTNLVEAGEYTLRDMLIIVFAVMFTLTSGSAVIVLNAKYDRQNKSAHEYL